MADNGGGGGNSGCATFCIVVVGVLVALIIFSILG